MQSALSYKSISDPIHISNIKESKKKTKYLKLAETCLIYTYFMSVLGSYICCYIEITEYL